MFDIFYHKYLFNLNKPYFYGVIPYLYGMIPYLYGIIPYFYGVIPYLYGVVVYKYHIDTIFLNYRLIIGRKKF